MTAPSRQQASSEPPTSPKPVPPPPNNTPVSTPPNSPPNSLATITIDSFKKTKKMAKQKAERAEKRHLVRWNDEMDKKLLLTVQYECNNAGVGIPWDKVGTTMGDEITGGAVVQHMAKLRARMVEQGLDVPPPLRRGGGSSRISTSKISSGTKKATPTKIVKKTNLSATKSKLGKAKKAAKKPSGSDDSDDDSNDDNTWDNDDSDGEYGGSRAKRARTHAKGPMRRKVKVEDSDEEINTPTKAPQRKPQKSKSSSHDLSAYGETDINGKPIDYGSDDDDDEKDDRVGAGEPWLFLDEENETKSETQKKSLVVSLPVTPTKPNMVGNTQEEDNGSLSEYEPEDEVLGGGVVNQEAAFTSPSVQLFNNHDNSFTAEEPQTMLFDEQYQGHQSFPDVYAPAYNSSIDFQASGGEDSSIQENTTELSGRFHDIQGHNLDFDQFSTDINHYSTGGYANLNGSGYQGGSVGGGGPSGLPYIQTSWPSTYGATGVMSSNTSVDQTPSGPSAGTDFGAGYFNNPDFSNPDFNNTDFSNTEFSNPEFDFESFDGANIDFSADDGADTLFDAGNVDGNFVGGGMYGSGYYGN